MRSRTRSRPGIASGLRMAAVALAVGLTWPGAAPASAAPAAPGETSTAGTGAHAVALSVVATPNSGKVGSVIQLVGSGWQPSTQLQAATCGQLAVAGSASCNLASAYSVVTDGAGKFGLAFTISRPPASCPCVVHVSAATAGQTVDVPIAIAGLPVAEVPKPVLTPAAPPISVVDAELDGWGPWTELFGGSPRRVLALTVRNSSDSSYRDVPVEVGDSADADARGDLVRTTVGPLPPHSAVTFRIAVQLSSSWTGHFRVYGLLDGARQFEADGYAVPWGTYLLGAAGLVLLGLAARRLLRARRARRTEQEDVTDDAELPAGR